ncbi:MAG: biopolymer transporter ExbD [Bacteroidales bacterium]|jgi:biopolymer transport protein ExbD|nr:biopolymer transporter ExbD [Bacteroidales bacterium]MDI9592054.1 biopolymer transporter ExbD [Bacteroidota bacterium]NLH33470.1 biopolymer transporter ExbD [Lentimicrobium sp.]OQC37813.1 MAG: biopolymer transport protein ExbD [Bacteroidetes bacterium ADurb.Bin041]MBP7873648.1 biopolymer transporter ExbD [Bacteroidales bacterium]
MAIQTRNKRSAQFSMASMSDLVFLLLIFFMLTSTLVAPNAIKLLLPQSSSKTMAKQTVTVYINDRFEYFIGEDQIAVDQMEQLIGEAMAGQVEGSVVLRADQSVPVQHIVNVIDAVNKINERYNTKHKVILATRPN